MLSPLAKSIVQNQFPEGDQFLFVRSSGKALEVEFIDPDATDADSTPDKKPVLSPDELGISSLKPIVFDAVGTPAEVDRIEAIYEKLCDELESDEWQSRKDASMVLTTSPEFWDSADRFNILAEIEYMDRLERALDTAESLLNRLRGEGDEHRESYSRVLVQRIANRLYVLESALEGESKDLPRDAFLSLEIGSEGKKDDMSLRFASELAQMYVNWAEARQMRYKVLVEHRVDAGRLSRFVIAIAGFGAYALLRHEMGLHVWEEYEEPNNHARKKVGVRVAAQPVPASKITEQLIAEAEERLADLEVVRNVVRRYRREPAPLVRDGVKGWRTGHLDRVLEGHFDLID